MGFKDKFKWNSCQRELDSTKLCHLTMRACLRGKNSCLGLLQPVQYNTVRSAVLWGLCVRECEPESQTEQTPFVAITKQKTGSPITGAGYKLLYLPPAWCLHYPGRDPRPEMQKAPLYYQTGD